MVASDGPLITTENSYRGLSASWARCLYLFDLKSVPVNCSTLSVKLASFFPKVDLIDYALNSQLGKALICRRTVKHTKVNRVVDLDFQYEHQESPQGF